MTEGRAVSMDEEVGLLVAQNEVLARSSSGTAAIVLRALTAYTGGIEIEFVFASRGTGPIGEFERWDNMDLSDEGLRIGFSFTDSAPVLHPPRVGGEDEPRWFPSNLWGGAGGDSSRSINIRRARIRVESAGEHELVKVGWSWRSQDIETAHLPFRLPTHDDVSRFVGSIWE